jgi:hypothetical protein
MTKSELNKYRNVLETRIHRLHKRATRSGMGAVTFYP